MPDKRKPQLPFFLNAALSRFIDAFNLFHPVKDPPSSNYFLICRKQYCRHFKVRRSTRYTVYKVCDEVQSALKDTIIHKRPAHDTVRRKKAHMMMVSMERLEHQKRRDMAILYSLPYFSIVLDGADQNAFGLPLFCTVSKTQRKHALKVKLIGLLEHDMHSVLHLY